MKRTKIICTIGPSSSDEHTLEEMIKAGMNVARLNFSHGTHEEHLAKIETIKRWTQRDPNTASEHSKTARSSLSPATASFSPRTISRATKRRFRFRIKICLMSFIPAIRYS